MAILIPIVYAVLGGFKTNGQLAATRSVLPDPWVFDELHRRPVGDRADVLAPAAATASSSRSIAVVLVVVLASRWRRSSSRGCRSAAARSLYTLFVFGLLFPSAVAILPLYILVRQLGLLDNPLGRRPARRPRSRCR